MGDAHSVEEYVGPTLADKSLLDSAPGFLAYFGQNLVRAVWSLDASIVSEHPRLPNDARSVLLRLLAVSEISQIQKAPEHGLVAHSEALLKSKDRRPARLRVGCMLGKHGVNTRPVIPSLNLTWYSSCAAVKNRRPSVLPLFSTISTESFFRANNPDALEDSPNGVRITEMHSQDQRMRRISTGCVSPTPHSRLT